MCNVGLMVVQTICKVCTYIHRSIRLSLCVRVCVYVRVCVCVCVRVCVCTNMYIVRKCAGRSFVSYID